MQTVVSMLLIDMQVSQEETIAVNHMSGHVTLFSLPHGTNHSDLFRGVFVSLNYYFFNQKALDFITNKINKILNYTILSTTRVNIHSFICTKGV